jgi:hypothetical protein
LYLEKTMHISHYTLSLLPCHSVKPKNIIIHGSVPTLHGTGYIVIVRPYTASN